MLKIHFLFIDVQDKLYPHVTNKRGRKKNLKGPKNGVPL